MHFNSTKHNWTTLDVIGEWNVLSIKNPTPSPHPHRGFAQEAKCFLKVLHNRKCSYGCWWELFPQNMTYEANVIYNWKVLTNSCLPHHYGVHWINNLGSKDFSGSYSTPDNWWWKRFSGATPARVVIIITVILIVTVILSLIPLQFECILITVINDVF